MRKNPWNGGRRNPQHTLKKARQKGQVESPNVTDMGVVPVLAEPAQGLTGDRESGVHSTKRWSERHTRDGRKRHVGTAGKGGIVLFRRRGQCSVVGCLGIAKRGGMGGLGNLRWFQNSQMAKKNQAMR